MSNKTEPKKMYHWMVAAQVVFSGKDAEEGGAININATLLTEQNYVNAPALAQAQRSIIANMQEKFQNAEMHVVDIVFLSFNSMGYMTQEEFNPGNSVKPGLKTPLKAV